MKTHSRLSAWVLQRNLCVFSVMLFGAVFAGNAAHAQAVTVTTIAVPTDFTIGLFQASDGNFYSTSGPANEGCQDITTNQCSFIYKITPSGTISVFHAFQEATTNYVPGTILGANADGLEPSSLIEGTDGNFYGTCETGGAYNLGTIFKITPYGAFTVLYTFAMANGTYVNGFGPNSLVQGFDGNLYGTTLNDVVGSVGTGGGGLFFEISTGGIFNALHVFPAHTSASDQNFDYPEGQSPGSILQGSDGNFYVTMKGGPETSATDAGAIDKITSAGQVTVFYAFPADDSQGSAPLGPLVEGGDGSFYGTTSITVNNPNAIPEIAYKMTSTGNLQMLHLFTGGADGGHTRGDLFLGGDGNLYGTTAFGGDTTSANCVRATAPGCGVFFQLQPAGVYSTLYTFEGGVDTSPGTAAGLAEANGASPEVPIAEAQGGVFYGTAVGGPTSSSTVFSLALANPIPAPVQLTFNPTTVEPGSPTQLTWKVLNAFSLSAQQCGAVIQGYPSGAGSWNGSQAGSFTNNDDVYTGTTTITPTLSGTYTYALTCGGNESGFATLLVKGPLMVPATLPNGLVSAVYSMPPSEFSGVPPYTTTVTSGTLPPGFSINPVTGLLQGTPTQADAFTFGLQVTDSDSPQATASGTTILTVNSSLGITTASLGKGVAGTSYSQTMVAVGGVTPYTWSVIAGTLPKGITLSPAGVLSGIATVDQTQMVTLQVMDSEGTPATNSASFSLVIGPPVPIAAVEFTQSIQQYQSLDDLKNTLNTTGEPLVPIIAGKFTAMRVYYSPLSTVTHYTLIATITGGVSQTTDWESVPNCQPVAQRANASNCYTTDFTFPAPSGTWSVNLVVNDSNGNQIETETLQITSRTTEAINLKSVQVCDLNHLGPTGGTVCGDPSILLSSSSTAYMASTMPTNSVTVQPSGQVVKLNSANYSLGSLTPFTDWEHGVAVLIDAFYNASDQNVDYTSNQRTTYFGIYNPQFDDGGNSVIAGHGAVAASSSLYFYNKTQIEGSIIAHETAHTLGLLHTNIPGPQTAIPPGCFGSATQAGSYWPFTTSDVVQSTTGGPEFGYDVPNQKVLNPGSTFDLMSYCYPDWLSPIQYKRAMIALGGGSVSSPSVIGSPIGSPEAHAAAAQPSSEAAATAHPHTAPPALTLGAYLQVAGEIDPTGVPLQSIFTQTFNGSADPGTGTYSIVLQNASGQALYTRYFTPVTIESDVSDGTTQDWNPIFSEWVPVTAGTASIAIFDPDNVLLTSQALTGTAPTVAITSPLAGFVGTGQQTVSWTIQNSTATTFTSRIFYSINGGTTWQQIDQVAGTSDTIDFSTMPGAPAALLRVDVSDGINTGSATSVAFSVPRHTPSAITINTPMDGAIQVASNPVYLSGAVYDADDGVLQGNALQWSDSVQGALGSGSPLVVTLPPGVHTLTLTGTDSDGNAISATTTITLAGAGPVLTLTTGSNATGCPTATIAATPGLLGVNLTQVQYSLDDGVTYTPVSLTSLPYTFVVPGSGAIYMFATALDASDQMTAQGASITQVSSCVPATLSISTGSSQSALVNTAFTTPLKVVVQNSSGTGVAGVNVSFTTPASGASATLSATSGTSAADGSVSITAIANGTAGSYSVTAAAAGITNTATFSLTNTTPPPPPTPDFQITAVSASLTATPTAPATDTINIAALGGFSSSVSLTCSGLPAGSTCAFSPSTVMIQNASGSSMLTVTAPANTAGKNANHLWPFGGGILTAGLLILLPKRRKLRHTLALCLFACFLVSLVGCNSSAPPPIVTTATMTVTASSGTLQHTVSIQVSIQ